MNSARKHGNIKIVSPAWITDSVWNWKKQDEEKYLLTFSDISPEEPEIENPESTPLELGFNWEDDEVDAILDDDDDDDDEEENFGSSLSQPPEVGVQDKSNQRMESSDSDDDDESDESFLADMDAILDSDAEENGEQEYGDSNDEEDQDLSDNDSHSDKRDRDPDNSGSEEEPSFKKRK